MFKVEITNDPLLSRGGARIAEGGRGGKGGAGGKTGVAFKNNLERRENWTNHL